MKSKIKLKIEKLSNEASQIIEQKNNFIDQIESINLRLTQIAGAIKELNDLLKEEDTDNGKEDTATD